jgi:hypothetical protein
MRAAENVLEGRPRPEPPSVAARGPLRRGLAASGGSDHAGAGAAEPRRSGLRPDRARQEQNAETPLDLLEPFADHLWLG